MRTQFLTKIEVAKMIANQFDVPEMIKEKVAIKLARLHEAWFIRQVVNSGFSVENFGYNRYFVK